MTLTDEIEKLIPRYRAYALSIASNSAEAEDLVSEVTSKMTTKVEELIHAELIWPPTGFDQFVTY